MVDPLDLIGKKLLGKYRLVRVLGEGGMGIVFEATELASGAPVAVKILSRSEAKGSTTFKRFQREMRTASLVGRPHVTEVYDVGMLATGEPFFVMEKVDGPTLRQRIAEERWLPLRDVVNVFVQLLAALEAVHAKGVIHRDIKPENLILARATDGTIMVKLIDFGVAKLQTSEGMMQEITTTGVVVGTVWYAAPEQVTGARDLDARVDLWGAGVCLYESLTGRRPFEGSEPLQLMLDIVKRPQPPVRATRPNVPAELDTIIGKALRKRREDRYATANEFRRDLVRFWSSYRFEPGFEEEAPAPAPSLPPLPKLYETDSSQSSESSSLDMRQAPVGAVPRVRSNVKTEPGIGAVRKTASRPAVRVPSKPPRR